MGNRVVRFHGCYPKARNAVANLLASPCLWVCQVMMQHYTELKVLKSILYLGRKLREADSSIFKNLALWERKGRKYCQQTAQSISGGFWFLPEGQFSTQCCLTLS